MLCRGAVFAAGDKPLLTRKSISSHVKVQLQSGDLVAVVISESRMRGEFTACSPPRGFQDRGFLEWM